MTEQPWRLASGGYIDRSKTLSFAFDGKVMNGHPGDTLASALLANGTRLVAEVSNTTGPGESCRLESKSPTPW